MSDPARYVRLYIGQHGTSANTVVTQATSEEITALLVGGAPFLLKSRELDRAGKVARSSAMLIAPSSGGVVVSITRGNSIPMDAQGRPVALTEAGAPAGPVAWWDDPAKAPISEVERLPWGEP